MTIKNDASTQRNNLSAAKQILLEKRIRGELKSVTKAQESIPRRSSQAPAYLSFAQQRLWFLYQLEPDSPVYNIPTAVRIKGPLNKTVLERSFNEIVRRHEALRTTFANVNEQPVQVVSPQLNLKLPVVDLRETSGDKREAEAQRLVQAEAQLTFDLAQNPPLRVKLLQLAEEECILLVTMHHIISDAWSLGVLWRELVSLYEAFLAGKPSSLPDLPIQYADFAHWQRERLQGPVLQSQLAYWKQQLAGVPAVLALPTDRPRPAIQTFRGACQVFPLPDALIEALQALGHQESATLFMTLLAAFKVLLYRYTGQEDVLVGTPIANRHWLAVEDLLGVFVNTLVMRTDLSDNPSFQELLGRVREVSLAAYAHQDLPFEQLVEELQPERDLSYTPLIQVTFSVVNAPMPTVQLPNLTWQFFEIDRGASQFDLSLSITDAEQGQTITVEYNTDLFDAGTIQRMMQHYQNLLAGIVADPTQRISHLSLLTAPERHQLLVVWNDTQADYPDHLCLHQLIEAQTTRTPDAPAVIFADQQLTYGELNQRANHMAHHLQELGVGPEVLVGICVERSLEMMVGLLGILKAGGAYLPLDPTDPPERLALILEDAQVPVLLTQKQLAPQLPAGGAHLVCMDADWEIIARQGEENPVSEVKPDNLVYVIYTSGSTGKPKGTMILHRGVVNYLTWCTRTYPMANGAGVPVHSSISFDLTVTSLFGPLLVGRAVYLLPKNLDPETLSVTLESDINFSLVKLTPAHLELLNQQVSPEMAAGRTGALIIGGENLPAKTIAFWQAHAPDTILVNEYGPTETVVGSCVYQVPPGEHRSGSVPIGRPIANTQIYVLDSHLQPVPIGVPGELYIGGVGVARGYLNRPELTRERFISNPFARTQDGDKAIETEFIPHPWQGKASFLILYKTGDLARYLPDGNLEYLGRLDDQVKLRGFRIELGEIETVLRQHPAVQETVVVMREDVPGDKRIVAYVVPQPAQNPTVETLRHFLPDKLPDYMLPAAIVFLEAIPLTSNGKVNRQALPRPDRASINHESHFVAPEDVLESKLVALWEEVLNVQPVGANDDFFGLGGHSLLAVQLFYRLEEVFGRTLPVTTLFQAPTIKQLAEVLRRQGWNPPLSSLVAIQPEGTRPPFFCVHGLGGGVLDYAELALNLGLAQPFYGLQERAMDGIHEPLTSVEDMAAYYLKEMQTLQPKGPYFLGGYCFGGTIAFEMARQLHAQGEQVALVAVIDNSPPKSGYYEAIWKPRIMIRFLKNLPYWLYDFLQLKPNEMWARILRKIRLAVQEIDRKSKPVGQEPTRADLESIIDDDLDKIPETYHRFLRAHYQALVNYTPQPYAGSIALFRTRRYSLLGPFDPQMGWSKLAVGGVEVHEIRGFHANILQSPYVQRLAERLRASLDESLIIFQ